MSAEIYIMRHGIAEDRSTSGADADRLLTAEGKRRVVEVARGLKALDVRPVVVVSSRLPRAMETATLTAEVLAKDIEVEPLTSLEPGYDAQATLDELEMYHDAKSVLLVGHQPHLGELASLLLTGSASRAPLPFRKGAVAAFEVDAVPPRYPGVLLWFMTAKQLRGLG